MSSPVVLVAKHEQLEALATPKTIKLFHWDKAEYNDQWIKASISQEAFTKHMVFVSTKTGTQAQGRGLYLTPDPSAYTVKTKESDELLVVQCINTPFIDVTTNPADDSELYKVATTKDAILKVADATGNPPKLLIQYGKYYRLSTIAGVTITADLNHADFDQVKEWGQKLVTQSDRTAYKALKKQATKNNVPNITWT
jgi:hypothetical protein